MRKLFLMGILMLSGLALGSAATGDSARQALKENCNKSCTGSSGDRGAPSVGCSKGYDTKIPEEKQMGGDASSTDENGK